MVFGCVQKFFLDCFWCILNWNSCVVCCISGIVHKLSISNFLLSWCKFLYVHLTRCILKTGFHLAIIGSTVSTMKWYSIGVVNAFFSSGGIACSINCNVVEVISLELSPWLHDFSVVDIDLSLVLSVSTSEIFDCVFLEIIIPHFIVSLPLSPSLWFLLELGVIPWNRWKLDCPSKDIWYGQSD
jgi:hypothetical protein